MAESDGSGGPRGRARPRSSLRRSAALLCLLLVVAAPLSVGVATADEPNFSATVPDEVLSPGATQELAFQLTNDDDDADERVETATNVRVEVLAGDTPFEVSSGTRALGTMADGDVRDLSVRLAVPATAEPGTYRVPVRVTYENDGQRRSETVDLTVRVEDRAFFRVDSVSSDVAVGETGTVEVTMTNVGNETASAASVSLASTSGDVRLGRTSSSSRYVGEWAPNETKTLTYEVTAGEDAAPLNYTLQAQVTYDDSTGVTQQSRPFRVGVTPAEEQSFAISDVESTLRVGEDGEVTGTVTNTGERPAADVVVRFEPSGATVAAAETEVAVGDLAPGESASFSFEASVGDEAGGGDRLFTFDVGYRNDGGDRRQASSQDVSVNVAPDRPRFAVSGVETNFSAGDEGTLTVRLTNVGDEPVTDLSAKLHADSPLSSSDDVQFVEVLESGQSVNLTYAIDVNEDAMQKSYPAKLDFRYDTPDGETHVSEAYRFAVDVEGANGGGAALSLPVIGIGLIAILLVFVVVSLFRRE